MKPNRAIGVALAGLLLAYSAYLLHQKGPGGVPWLPGCVFQKVTGFDCAGCGMTRATHAALHGNFADAFGFNPVGMILFPLALFGLALEVVGWVRGRPLPWRVHPGVRGTWVIAGVIIAFTVLRNVPVWPLTLLAP